MYKMNRMNALDVAVLFRAESRGLCLKPSFLKSWGEIALNSIANHDHHLNFQTASKYT